MRSQNAFMPSLVLMSVFLVSPEIAESRLTVAQLRTTAVPFRKSCIRKVGTTEAAVRAVENGDFSQGHTFQCYYKCALEKMKAIKHNKLDPEEVHRQVALLAVDDEIKPLTAMVNDCFAKASSEDICEAAWQTAQCCFSTIKELCPIP
ncbi:general odorant-binding protein 83a [Orussus abietinus]|uniref:general odorant-binding protein 83a n=1 Tax=Orussus abietinus TaxID=222816 RepID=UPI000625BBEC|nr:general odorant-binding protein 83a [Orussus abietinus]